MRSLLILREDLRLADNPALAHALKHSESLAVVYVLGSSWLGDAQRWWLHHSLAFLKKSLNGHLILRSGDFEPTLQSLTAEGQFDAVYWNKVYTPNEFHRDNDLAQSLRAQGTHVQTFPSALLAEPWDLQAKSGDSYKVFTPFWKALQSAVSIEDKLHPAPSVQDVNWIDLRSDSLDSWQLLPTSPNWASSFGDPAQCSEAAALATLKDFLTNRLGDYSTDRDFPSIPATSELSVPLHFGQISPARIWNEASNFPNTTPFLRQLAWRDFSYHLLFHFPKFRTLNWNPRFDAFPWHQNPEHLNAWKRGQTGYPIIDAGMRELWQTGRMHNRVRMLTASFLTKHLLVDWRKGRSFFEETLLDADLANNSSGWQWVAGCGADAAPYFRIFNPILQSKRFDPEGKYIRKWLPELDSVPTRAIHAPWEWEDFGTLDYPAPIVDHNTARQKALAHYQQMKDSSQ